MSGSQAGGSRLGGSMAGGSRLDGSSGEMYDKERDLLELRLRTAVGTGKKLVRIENNDLGDDEIKVLVIMLNEAESAARKRLYEYRKAQSAAEKARAERLAAEFQAFVPDAEPDPDEIAYEEACNVIWDDDPYVPPPLVIKGEGEEEPEKPREAPPSYRFTPRDERGDRQGQRITANVGGHARGRATVLFRKAWQRHTLQQKELIAEAARKAIEYEEGGAGCHHLLLQQNRLGSLGTSHICSLVRASEVLETIALGQNPIGDTGAALLGRALNGTRVLRTLALQECGIGTTGVKHLSSGLARNRSLTALWLYGNAAGDEGTAHLAGALRACKLESLGLEKNGIQFRGCEALGVALAMENCTLCWLRLQHNALGDEGVVELATALDANHSLTHLQLRDVGVGERGVRALGETIHKHPTLTRLGLEQNPFIPSATSKLLQAMQEQKESVLTKISLDIDRGGGYERTYTRDDFTKKLALNVFGKAASKQAGGGASSYVGKIGYNPFSHLKY